ncbi:TIGR03960 family B12-binding radical SAM protein [Thermodesulfobacteriota bacterium]
MVLFDQKWFSRISRPSRYIGNEINARVEKYQTAEVSIALAFPDVYEVGMSHLGLKIIYHLLNKYEWLSAERVFCPWTDLEQELKKQGAPLSTLESNRPLSEFDILGFSLQHELSFTNVLSMLNLAGIPFLASERSDSDPLIIAGGPSCFNPEPVADIFDLIVVGDGEEVIQEICVSLRKTKHKKYKDKQALLSDLRRISGVYIPSFFSFTYDKNMIIQGIDYLESGYESVHKAVIPDINRYPCPDSQVLPFTELVHDRLSVEISRGCTRGCRFCQAGMIYRPVRERHPNAILSAAESGLKLTGYDELSLLSLSSGDYTLIKPLLKAVMDKQAREKISVSLPSLRIDSMDLSWIEQIKRVRKTGFTLAPEAGNNRMRRIINKGLSDKEILETARIVYGAGWKMIKLYFMIGLPGEKESDIRDIVNLAMKISELGGKKRNKNNLTVGISTFVPKAHTPFMWMKQIPLEESKHRLKIIQDEISGPIRLKWNQPEFSWLEGIFSRGDRRLCRPLIRAFELGARFDAWGEQFRMDIWQKAFEDEGTDIDFYLNRERTIDEILPWDHIRSGVNKQFLLRELKRSTKEKISPDCREKCLECGVCDHETIFPRLSEEWNPPSPSVASDKPPSKGDRSLRWKYSLTFTKMGPSRFLSQLELANVFSRAFRRAQLKLAYSEGYHPMPKISFLTALPVGTESMDETVNLELLEKADPLTLKEKISQQMPRGIDVIRIKIHDFGSKIDKIVESHFKITLNGTSIKKDAIKKFLNSDYVPIIKTTKKGKYKLNSREMVNSMQFVPPNVIELAIKNKSGPKLRPAEIIKEIFSLTQDEMESISILKTRQILENINDD